MPKVVIIGAGAFGCAAAWHCRERGCEVLILEARDAAATQASRNAAGFVALWALYHSPAWGPLEWEIEQYGISFYSARFEAQPEAVAFRHCGIAYVYVTADAWRASQPRLAAAQKQGTPLEVLNEARAAELVPELTYSETQGIVFDHSAIRLRSADAIPALAEDLRRNGVDMRMNTSVTALLADAGRVCGVETDAGPIAADHVVIAAGAWTPSFVAAYDAPCPATPAVATRYTTKPLPGTRPEMPLVIFADSHGLYVREERGGLLIGGYDDGGLTQQQVDTQTPPLSHTLSPEQAERTQEYAREMATVMPLLTDADIDRVDSGLPTYTADLRCIVDEIPGHAGAYYLAGCNEAGITHGPGLGKLVSELALDGRSDWDQFRVARFLKN